MINIKNKENCCGCHACMAICHTNSITLISDNEGFLYPQVDLLKCINCNSCEKVCPILNPTQIDNTSKAYAAYNKNEQVRKESSSGGVFTLLAEEIINAGGVVFGACFNENFDVVHGSTEKKEDLRKFRGAKYVQSKIGDTYKQVKDNLVKGNFVLFTGTPCQIGGLYAYLNKKYENLITQDIICHGVPSPKVWKKYLNFREIEASSKTKQIFFRYKKSGWKTYSVMFNFINEVNYIQFFFKDLYMRGFLSDLYLRPSCYNCRFKTIHRAADITLADFWGIQHILPAMDDDKGTSLIIVNSTKGNQLFKKIEKKINFIETNLNKAIFHNPSMTKSAVLNSKRKKFFDEIDKYNIKKLINKYCNISFRNKCINLFKKILRKIGLLGVAKKILRKN